MLDIQALQRRGCDTAIPFAVFGQPLKLFGRRAHESAAVDSIQVFGRGLREQAAIIARMKQSAAIRRPRSAPGNIGGSPRQRSFHRQMNENPIKLVSAVPQLLGEVVDVRAAIEPALTTVTK